MVCKPLLRKRKIQHHRHHIDHLHSSQNQEDNQHITLPGMLLDQADISRKHHLQRNFDLEDKADRFLVM